MQKDLISVINCPLCCMNWYFGGIIRSSKFEVRSSQFASYPYTFASYSHNCKILQPYVPATVRMYSDAICFFVSASRMKIYSSKINARQQIMVIYKQMSVRTHKADTYESALLRNFKMSPSITNSAYTSFIIVLHYCLMLV